MFTPHKNKPSISLKQKLYRLSQDVRQKRKQKKFINQKLLWKRPDIIFY